MRAVCRTALGGRKSCRCAASRHRQPTGDQVLLHIRASGVCYHDLLVRDGTYRQLVKLPLVPGHEMAGDVIAVGEEVTRIKVGDQVASTNRETCGQCDLCRSGQEGMCPNQRFFGHNGPGELRRVCACARECTFGGAALDPAGDRLHALLRSRHRTARDSRGRPHQGGRHRAGDWRRWWAWYPRGAGGETLRRFRRRADQTP